MMLNLKSAAYVITQTNSDYTKSVTFFKNNETKDENSRIISQNHQLFVCPTENGVAGFGSHECMWIPSEKLELVFHRVFIYHLIGQEHSPLGDDEYTARPAWRLNVQMFLEKSCPD